jgi:hypothetical protein
MDWRHRLPLTDRLPQNPLPKRQMGMAYSTDAVRKPVSSPQPSDLKATDFDLGGGKAEITYRYLIMGFGTAAG